MRFCGIDRKSSLWCDAISHSEEIPASDALKFPHYQKNDERGKDAALFRSSETSTFIFLNEMNRCCERTDDTVDVWMCCKKQYRRGIAAKERALTRLCVKSRIPMHETWTQTHPNQVDENRTSERKFQSVLCMEFSEFGICMGIIRGHEEAASSGAAAALFLAKYSRLEQGSLQPRA